MKRLNPLNRMKVDNETSTTVFSGDASTGASFIKDMLKVGVEGKVIDAGEEILLMV